jgi:hypothetical protein
MAGHVWVVSEEQQLTEEARRSRDETQRLREESGLGGERTPGSWAPDSKLPDDAPEGESWAKTSSGDAANATDDED